MSAEESTQPKVRVLIAKPGLDGHDRGAKIVARALRDGGCEVIYTGIRQTPEMIVSAAVQENADIKIAIINNGYLSGAHLELFPRIVEQITERGLDDVTLFCGGIIPEEDTEALTAMGFSGIFRPGTNTQDIVDFVHKSATVDK